MATREITQLPDRFTGDINNIRDKKIAEASDATAASDITSQCEYLIKNGQTGEFMNVLKSYIDESIRSALGALVSNLDKGTSISKVLATDSSNDLGTITPANLASVLSVPSNNTIRSQSHAADGSIDYAFDNCTSPGIYFFAGSNSNNAPANKYDYYIVEVKSYWRGVFQIATVINNDYNNLNKQFRRAKPNNGTWSAWKEM